MSHRLNNEMILAISQTLYTLLHQICFFRHSGQYFGQFREFDGKVKVLPHFRHFLVIFSTGWYFALHSWQQSGQCWTFSGRVKVFPQILHVLVIIPQSCVFGCLSFPANSFFNHSNIDLPFSSGILFQNSWQWPLFQYLLIFNLDLEALYS